MRLSSSPSSSSSVHRSSGFFAAPLSLTLTVSFRIDSSILVRVALPGGESKYCFINMAAKPFEPPK